MPVTTENYMLEAFLDGDAYSALADKRRFSIIDNQFNIMTEIAGDGVITGWDIVPLTFPNVRVTKGTGLIDQFHIATFDDQDFELDSSSTFNFYAQRRVGITGTIGPRSDVVSSSYTDASAPVTPVGFVATVGSDPFFSVNLTWTANTEIDLDHYELRRSINLSSGFVLIASITNTETSYTDISPDEDTLYYYRLQAVDQSEFASSPATDSVTTELSPNLPPNPTSVTMFHSEDAINILWKRPTSILFSKIKEWRITYAILDGAGLDVLDTQIQKTINKSLYDYRIDGLENGQTYNVTIQTVDIKNRVSVGFSSHVIPQPTSAPQDPILLDLAQSQQVEDKIILNLEWTDGADEYDPLIPHRYRIYITIDGQEESAPIETFNTEFQVEVYTLPNSNNQMSIPENTLITLRLTSLTNNGIESFGTYTRLVTDRHGQPLQISNLSSIFDPDTSKITVTWINQADTANIFINIFDEFLDGSYTGTIIDQFIGHIENYVFDAELNHRYTITVTPFDVDNVAGPSDITVEITLIAGGIDKPLSPVNIFRQPGDRQVKLSWDASPSITTVSYRIYRKSGTITIIATDWTILDTVPRTHTEFTNYGLENNTVYSYYITSIDLYGQESEHLPDGAINLNFVESIPRPSGILTDPDNVVTTLNGNDIAITWESLLEEFDAFVINRSVNNLHNWQEIATVDRNTTSYTDIDVSLVDGNTFYYTVHKVINDSDIVVQLSNVAPENSICIGKLTLGVTSFGTPVITCKRNILNLVDPLSEWTSQFLLTHLHRRSKLFDPDRIDLEPELVVTDWTTVDGRIFTTEELDIVGTGYVVKIGGRFPQTFFSIDAPNGRLVFTEPIVAVDGDGNVTGELPEITVNVRGIEEVQGILPGFRFDKIHARQMAFGRINSEQMPSINHEGRIRETMLPKTFLLQRFSNHTFIIPEEDTDSTKNFGNGTTFYATVESDGLIVEVIDFDQENDGDVVAFRSPHFSATTLRHLASTIHTSTSSGTHDSAYDKDGSTWFANPDVAILGSIDAEQFDLYLRMQINVPRGSSVQSSSITIQKLGYPNVGEGSVDCDISILDPSDVPSSVELTSGNGPGIRAGSNLGGLTVSWESILPPIADCDAESTPDLSILVQAFVDTAQYSPGAFAVFRLKEKVSGSNFISIGTQSSDTCNEAILNTASVRGLAEVTSNTAFQSEKSYHLQFGFRDTSSSRWCRITTSDAPNKPNPIIDLKKRLRFKMLLETGSIYICLGIREVNLSDVTTGSNGGTSGSIEWVGATSFVTDLTGNPTPIGKLIQSSSEWQEIEFDLEVDSIINFENGDNLLGGDFGVLEHLAFTIVPDATGAVGPFDIYIDKIEQVDDILAAGTSQGIMVSRDFGSSWEVSRLLETPVHAFYRAFNNQFLWAISANEVLLSVDPINWFPTSGLTGIQYIRDITEDEFGNMYISTERGVFWFEIALISTFASWRQTQAVNAFTTDCYGLYHNPVASGIDEIWTSTEIGIYKTTNNGTSWTDTEMSTQGIPAFQFINISTNPLIPNIIAITRKHVLRKLGSEIDFSIIANFEVQHDIFDIWKMEYFIDKLYISTGKGIYSNSLDELFDPSPLTTVFEKVFPGLEVNGTVGVAFGLDAVTVNSPQGLTVQLFIGQENRLIVADENNEISIKEQFPNKELPSFFADNNELTIGYIYSAFNNVLVFRSPQPVNKLYKAAHLPRKIYLPINGSWSQTNPESDVFIYFNGIPKWLDFNLDQDSILSEVQNIQSIILPLRGTLNTFNSLHPQSEQYLELVLADITALISGGEGDGTTPLVNNSTIIPFLNNYTRFISLLTTSFLSSSNIDTTPQINLLGFTRSERETGSLAEDIETKEEFVANESTGIIIDTFAGEVDFLTISAQTTNLKDRLEFAFNKYDKLEISIFNANVSNIGEFTHREIEDQMEAVNTGLSSHLSRAYYTNLIKTGIFFEKTHHNIFNVYNVSNVQSKYYSSHTNNWYDAPNSTIDYNLIDSVGNHPESRFGNATYFFGNNSTYIPNRIWVGTDNDILQYSLDSSTGDPTLEEVIRPGNGTDPMFIWDIFVLGDNEDDIYVVAEEKDAEIGHIFRTIDNGANWEDLDTINVPSRIYQFTIMSGNKVATTEEGIYFSDNTFGTWFPANIALSPQLSSDSLTVAAFRGRILNIGRTTFLVAESDGWFYTSGTGADWFALSGRIGNNNTQIVNKLVRFKNVTWVATDKGLYNDGNSILSNTTQFGLQILEDTAGNSTIPIGDIAHGANTSDALYCSGVSTIYQLLNNTWVKYEPPNIVGIHKIIFCRISTKDFLVIISHNTIQTIDVTPGEGVFG